jgi:hypothetical protein
MRVFIKYRKRDVNMICPLNILPALRRIFRHLTRAPFLAHSVSNLLDKQVLFWPHRDLGQGTPIGARLVLHMPPASHYRERCGAFFVVIPPPCFNLVPGIIQAEEPVLIEAFLPEPAVKGLDIGVVRRLPGPGEVQRDMVPVSPEIDVLGDELWAINPNRSGSPMMLHDPLQDFNHLAAANPLAPHGPPDLHGYDCPLSLKAGSAAHRRARPT